MKTIAEWTTYRTRFLVKAKQLNYTLTFTDALGREHHGNKGDYLVESTDGVLRIAPRQIFEDIYVPLAERASEPERRRKKLPHPESTTAFQILPHVPGNYPPPCRDSRPPIAGVRFL